MSAENTAFGEMHVKATTLSELFDVAISEGLVDEAAQQQTIAMYCHVNEGSFCYLLREELLVELGGENQSAIEKVEVDREAAKDITRDLDPKLIEHSRYNMVRLRCHNQSGEYTCEADRGDGWQSIPIT